MSYLVVVELGHGVVGLVVRHLGLGGLVDPGVLECLFGRESEEVALSQHAHDEHLQFPG